MNEPLEQWRVAIPGVDDEVTVYARTGEVAISEACSLYDLNHVPLGTVARSADGKEIRCSSATS